MHTTAKSTPTDASPVPGTKDDTRGDQSAEPSAEPATTKRLHGGTLHNTTVCTGRHLKSNPTNCEPVKRLGSDVSVHPYVQNGEEANEATRSQEASAPSGETRPTHHKTVTVLTEVEVSQNQTNSVSGATSQRSCSATQSLQSQTSYPSTFRSEAMFFVNFFDVWLIYSKL